MTHHVLAARTLRQLHTYMNDAWDGPPIVSRHAGGFYTADGGRWMLLVDPSRLDVQGLRLDSFIALPGVCWTAVDQLRAATQVQSDNPTEGNKI